MVTVTELSSLAAALGAEQNELISLVGGGGKTTTLFTLGAQMAGTTVLTTTTKMGSDQSSGHTVLLDPTDEQIRHALDPTDPILAWKRSEGHRAVGVSAETCDRWFSIVDNVVVEADGSRKRPFKAPADYEPVIPSRTTLLIACIGVSALGKPIAEGCHRPERVAALTDLKATEPLTPAAAAVVLRHPMGSMKDRPPDAKYVVALHRVTPADDALIDELAARLGSTPLVAIREVRAT